MKRSLRKCQIAAIGPKVRGTLGGLLVGCVLVSAPFVVCAGDNFQMNALFNPSQAALAAEDRGRVMIYDKLDNDMVERALDTQFERIEHMMFTRIRHTQPDGAVSIDDDGC